MKKRIVICAMYFSLMSIILEFAISMFAAKPFYLVDIFYMAKLKPKKKIWYHSASY